MFEVYLKLKNSEPPENNVYYIIAENGLFLRKRNNWIDAVVPVKRISMLENQDTWAKLLLPKIDGIVMAKSVKFLKAIYKKYHTESVVLLHYGDESGWALTVPEQNVSSYSARYTATERLPGYLNVGTMHSHSDIGAFHSGTDIRDEAEADGIHITIGNLGKKSGFSMDAEIVVNGRRFPKSPGAVAEGIEHEVISGISAEHTPLLGGAIDNSGYLWRRVSGSRLYTLTHKLEYWRVPKQWIDKINAPVTVKAIDKVFSKAKANPDKKPAEVIQEVFDKIGEVNPDFDPSMYNPEMLEELLNDPSLMPKNTGLKVVNELKKENVGGGKKNTKTCKKIKTSGKKTKLKEGDKRCHK